MAEYINIEKPFLDKLQLLGWKVINQGQMADCDIMKASSELRVLKGYNLLISKGKGRATYYIPAEVLNTPPLGLSTPPPSLSTPPSELSTPPLSLSTPPFVLSTPPLEYIPENIQLEIKTLGKRVNDAEILKKIILNICAIKPFKSTELAEILGKREDYIKRKFLGEMITAKQLKYLHPEMINHPNQAYLTNNRA